MTIPIAIHAKRIIGTALAYCAVPSCGTKETFMPYQEPEYVECNYCLGCGEDDDGDECFNCDGSGQILNPKRLKKSKITSKRK